MSSVTRTPATETPPWAPGGSPEGWTVPMVLRERARREPDRVGLREKWLGIYEEFSWEAIDRHVCDIAAGLIELGVERGDHIAIMGDPRREYVFCELAVSMAGAVSTGVYPTNAPAELRYQMEDSGATVIIVENQEHLDKLLSVRAELDELRHVIVIDTRTLFLYDRSSLLMLEDVQLRGAELRRQDGELIDRRMAQADPDDTLCLIYTSGTTGSPKGVMHSHRTLLYATESLLDPAPELRLHDQRLVVHLPIAHVVGKLIGVTVPLLSRVVPHLPENPELFAETVYEVAPTYVCQPPRFFEKFAAQMIVTIETGSRLKRAAYRAAMRVGRAVTEHRYRGAGPPLHLRAAYALARALVLVPLLRQIGYHRVRHAHTGSAPVPPEVASLWHAWGMDLRIIYGLTESGGIVTAQYDAFPVPADIGCCLRRPEWECRVAEDGELLFRGPSNFLGYWQRPDATAETIVDGWLRTGDVVEAGGEGRFRLIDRKKDLVITSGGKSLSPQQIENQLKASPYVSEAVILAEGRKYVTALLELDDATVSDWCRARGVTYTSYGDLVARPEVVTLIDGEVARANARLSRVEQIKRFRIMPVELEPEDGEVTPTRKIKRKLIEQMFGELIEEMYRGAEGTAIGAQVGGLAEHAQRRPAEASQRQVNGA